MREMKKRLAERSGDRPTERAAGWTMRQWQRREYEAVCDAVNITRRLPDGKWRVRLLKMMYWDRSGTRTLPGAAMECHISERTASRWHGEFVRLVASLMGMME